MAEAGVSIILPNYNGKTLIERNLPFLINSVKDIRFPVEIIVVDDASSDGSVEFIRTKFPKIKLISQTKNLGFSRTCNRGATESLYDKLLFLNTDMRVEPDFLMPLVESLTIDAFAVSGRVTENCSGNELNVGITYGHIKGYVLAPERLNLDVEDNFGDAKREILWATGGMMLCWKDKFLELGGFDTIYSPFYFEDSDLSYHAWKKGWKVYYEPRSVVFHEHQGTIGRLFKKSYVKTICERNQFLFMWKNITDKDIIFRFSLAFLFILVIPNPVRQLGALMSLKYLFQIIKRRRNYADCIVFSDNELINRFKCLKNIAMNQ